MLDYMATLLVHFFHVISGGGIAIARNGFYMGYARAEWRQLVGP